MPRQLEIVGVNTGQAVGLIELLQKGILLSSVSASNRIVNHLLWCENSKV